VQHEHHNGVHYPPWPGPPGQADATRFSPYSILLLYPLIKPGAITNPAPSKRSFLTIPKEPLSLLKPSATTTGSSTRSKMPGAFRSWLTPHHLGSLPTVWIPPYELRDERELPRTRMALSKIRTALKNRMDSTLAKYALSLDTQSGIYAPKWRSPLLELVRSMPEETRRCMEQ